MAGYNLIIIGGGNLGLWTAYHLAKRGMQRILVCERYWAGYGATMRSAGIVRQQGGSETAIKLGKWSRELYRQLGEELGVDSGFHQVGYYLVASSAMEQAVFERLVELRQAHGVANEWLSVEELKQRLPYVNWERFVGATYTPDDGYAEPAIIARNIVMAVRQQGVELLEQCQVQQVEQRANGFVVHTNRGTFETERVLNAAGPRGARQVGAMLGLEIPVAAARHMVVSFPTRPASMPPNFPMMFILSSGYYLRPDEQGILLGFSNPLEQPDPGDRFLLEFDWEYFEKLKPDWESALPDLRGLSIGRAWTGSIDYTPDQLPIIDEPLFGFFVLAAGGHGIMWGPGLGMKMAELILDERVTELPDEEIRLSRFAEGRGGRDAIHLPFPQ